MDNEKSAAQKAAETARAVAGAAKAATKAIAGDVVGAAKEFIKNPKILLVILAPFLVLIFLFVGIAMMIGTGIWAAAENITSSYSENYAEELEKAGIESGGSAFYLYNSGSDVMGSAIVDTIKGVFTSIKDHFVDGEDATNTELDPEGEGKYSSQDMEDTVEAIVNDKAMMAAVRTRLDMIKTRVAQRGEQIKEVAMSQYEPEIIGNMAADIASRIEDNPFLYAGIGNVTFDIDTSCFELTDLQALKILCAYSVQHDADITEVDMWDLMDYLGWYGISSTDLPADHLVTDSIYAPGDVTAKWGGELPGILGTGDDLTADMTAGVNNGGTVYQLSALKVPYWSGRFYPQWYIEEQAAIRQMNEKYWECVESGKPIPPDVVKWGRQESKDDPLTGIERLDNYDPYGLIDKLYRTSTASITVTPTEFNSYTTIPQEFLGGVWQGMKDLWHTAFNKPVDTSVTDSFGNKIDQTYISYNYSILNDIEYRCKRGYIYSIKDEYGNTLGSQRASADGEWLTFSGLEPGQTYYIYEGTPAPPQKPNPDGSIEQVQTRTIGESRLIYYFTTTTPKPRTVQAYKLDVEVNITFSSLSVDRLITDTIGLWSGSMTKVEETPEGIYQEGQKGNELLMYQWQDTAVNSNGEVHNLTFQRKNGYQAEYYRDSVMGLGQALGLAVDNLYAPGTGYGQNIVATALSEYNQYEGTGGAKYWQAYADYNGCYPPSANTAWCVAFVYYCAYQCGYLSPEGDGCFGSEWQINCGTVWDWFNERKQLQISPDYVPNPGDLILYGAGNPANPSEINHIGIVEAVTPEGKLMTIEGNYDNRCSRNTFDGYSIGTGAGGNGTIIAYCTPAYPNTNVENMQFVQTHRAVSPNKQARFVGDNKVLLVGIPRMTRKEADTFVLALPGIDPDFSKETRIQELIEAAKQNKPDREFAAKWNQALSLEDEKLSKLQIKYSSENVVAKIQQEVMLNTDFNWSKSLLRHEILWAVSSSTSNPDAAAAALSTISDGLGNNASDEKVLKAYQQMLPKVFQKHGKLLWMEYDAKTVIQWQRSLQDLVPMLQKAYLDDKANH